MVLWESVVLFHVIGVLLLGVSSLRWVGFGVCFVSMMVLVHSFSNLFVVDVHQVVVWRHVIIFALSLRVRLF